MNMGVLSTEPTSKVMKWLIIKKTVHIKEMLKWKVLGYQCDLKMAINQNI